MTEGNLTFDRAISLSTDLIYALDTGETTAAAAAEHLDSIISTTNGARGFFVALLTGDSKIANDLPEEFIEVFTKHPEITCDLLIKNLIMSATMALTHERNGDMKMQASSKQVCERTTRIIQRLDNEAMSRQVSNMTAAIEHKLRSGDDDHGSEYSPFLTRWRYDAEQLKLGLEAISALKS